VLPDEPPIILAARLTRRELVAMGQNPPFPLAFCWPGPGTLRRSRTGASPHHPRQQKHVAGARAARVRPPEACPL